MSISAGTPFGYDFNQILSTLSLREARLVAYRFLSFLGAYASRGSGAGTRGIVQRSAAKRGEAGAEDGPGVDQIGVGHDVVGERRLRFGHERPDQSVDQPRGHGARFALRGFARRPVVEPALRPAAEMARGNEHREL